MNKPKENHKTKIFLKSIIDIFKAAACGTWTGDMISAIIVTDMMLQDNLYPTWAPGLR